jgi:hypothetical protein
VWAGEQGRDQRSHFMQRPHVRQDVDYVLRTYVEMSCLCLDEDGAYQGGGRCGVAWRRCMSGALHGNDVVMRVSGHFYLPLTAFPIAVWGQVELDDGVWIRFVA